MKHFTHIGAAAASVVARLQRSSRVPREPRAAPVRHRAKPRPSKKPEDGTPIMEP